MLTELDPSRAAGGDEREVSPLLRRPRNSVPSSIMVRSAVTSTSNTPSNPILRSAATILPCTFVPIGIKALSEVTRTEGAVPTTTCFVLSASAFQTLSVQSRSVSAPVGHTVIHWPQDTHAVSSRLRSNAQKFVLQIPVVGTDYSYALCLFTDVDTATAQDALGIVPNEMDHGVFYLGHHVLRMS